MSNTPALPSIKPQKAIRRFDVFAEFNRLEALKDGRTPNEAKGHGIWLAKVVASRQRRASDGDGATAKDSSKSRRAESPPEFRSIGGELQTDQTFDHDIIERMGPDFYAKVFSPAVKAAFDEGMKYEDIRDQVRGGWKPD